MSRHNISLIIAEKDKYIKGTNMGSFKVQQVFDYYLALGLQQTYAKEFKIRKLHNLAVGTINPEDYITGELPEDIGLKEDFLENPGLTFFPIVPNLELAILGDYDKKYTEFVAQAVNRENTNEVISNLNAELRDLLISKAENLFLAENPNPTEEEIKLFQESSKIQSYYKKEYRTEVEKWANYTMAKEDLKFDMKGLGRGALQQMFRTEKPTIHVDYTSGSYKPEKLNEKDTFYLKSPMAEDYCYSQMFGWFEYSNLGTILNTETENLNEEQVKKLEKWVSNYYRTGFVVNNEIGAITGNKLEDFESTQNYLTFKQVERSGSTNLRGARYNDVDNTLIRKTTIYALLPRKVGKLTYKGEGVYFSDLVDESFIITKKAKYIKGKKKTIENLISGEHIDWFFINELWRGKKLDINRHGNTWKGQTSDQESIWLELRKHPIQYSDLHNRYGVIIPVHGGSVTDYYNDSYSLVEKIAPWQIFYNWIWNRNQQLLATEVGKMLILNQAAIPDESMGETWGKNNLLKWMLVGRDTGVAPIDTSLSHLGQQGSALHGGVGQVVDLTKTQEILEKATLARQIKLEAYQLVGMTEEYIYGDISPKQSGISVAQGLQRSLTQIQHLYTRLDNIMKRVRTTMLETAQFIESNNPISEVSYLTSDSARVIFRTNTEGFLLHKLDVYTKSTIADEGTLERIKSIAASSNTLGATTLEMASLQASKSIPEMFNKLKVLEDEKLKREEEERNFQVQQQQEVLNQQREIQEKEIAALEAREESSSS